MIMNLAAPAPKVEPAIADAADYTEAAIADGAMPCEPAQAEPAPAVESAFDGYRTSDTDEDDDDDVYVIPPYVRVSDSVSFDTRLQTCQNPKNTKKNKRKNNNISSAAAVVEKSQNNDDNNHNIPIKCLYPTDFECRAAVVCHGADNKSIKNNKGFFNKLLQQRHFLTYSEIARHIVIKDEYCFVYIEKTDLAPLYTFSFLNMYSIIEDPNKPDKDSYTINPIMQDSDFKTKPNGNFVTVLLKDKNTRKLEYQITFDLSSTCNTNMKNNFSKATDPIAKRFVDIINYNCQVKKHQALFEDELEEDEFNSVSLGGDSGHIITNRVGELHFQK